MQMNVSSNANECIELDVKKLGKSRVCDNRKQE